MRHLSLRQRLSLLWLVFLLLLLIGWQQGDRVRERVLAEEHAIMASQVEVANMASAVFTAQLINQARALLNAVRQFHQKNGALAETEQFIRYLGFDRSLIDNIYLLDAQGRIVIAHDQAAEGLLANERRYFKHHRQQIGQDLYIAPVEPGLVSGKLHFRVSMRVDRDDGAFDGVVLATLRPDAFTIYYRQLAGGHRWLFSLIGVDDRLLRARFPEPAVDQWVQPARVAGLDLPTAQMAGEFFGTSSVDGVERHYAYRKLANWPLVMIIGYTHDEVEERVAARLDRLQWLVFAGVLVIFLVTTMLTVVMLARHRLEGVNRRLAHSYHLMREQAMTDALTGLPARPMFFDRMAHALALARRENRPLGLLFMDLDGFKPVNDQHGHDAGDVVLKVVAQRWLAAVRASDTVARVGGDEFAVIVADMDSTQVLAGVCNKLLGALAEPILLPSGASVKVGASIGIALYPDNAQEIDSLLAAADTAMYQSKARGKNVFTWATCHPPAHGAKAWISLSEAQQVGIPEIDEQHQQLVRMVNQLNHCICTARDEGQIKTYMAALQVATVHHFATERDYMQRYGYPGLAAHEHEHVHLLDELARILDEASPGSDLLGLQMIKDWLLGHIEGSDKALGEFLVERGAARAEHAANSAPWPG